MNSKNSRAVKRSSSEVSTSKRSRKPSRKSATKSSTQSFKVAPSAFRRLEYVNAPVSTGYRASFKSGGFDDIMRQRFSYQAGFVYVGNNTLGKSGGVYAVENTQTDLLTNWIPIMPPDALLGQSYIADVWKHYARVRYHAIKLHVMPISIGNATSTQLDVVLAPYRGGAIAPTLTTTTTAANNTGNVIGQSGSMQFNIWCGATMDLTPYIAGGSGAKQNEFNIPNSVAITSSTVTTNSLVSPAGWILAGDTVASTYDGAYLGRMYCEVLVDLLDFTGGFTEANPEVTAAREMSRKRFRDCKIDGTSKDRDSDTKYLKLDTGKISTEDHFVRVDASMDTSSDLPLTAPLLLRQNAQVRTQSQGPPTSRAADVKTSVALGRQ